jgi:23S rRNA G2069 N7-methylase RlmK/C1962 C5-methylase RlmI
MDIKTERQAEMFANRLQKNFRHLKKWAPRTGAGVFRLYDRDIPEVPLILDFFGDCVNLREASLSGAIYKRPYEKDEAEEENWINAMKQNAALALGINEKRIFIKQRERHKGCSQYGKFDNARFTRIISEGGLNFKVNLSDYLDCGLFPDRRLLRSLVRSDAEKQKVLNLFCYTGSFSVYAASGQALSTDSVDLSNTYLARARENFSLNGYSPRLFSRQGEYFASCGRIDKHNLIRADVLHFLKQAISVKKKWNIIILDPPAFSNSKKMADIFDFKRDKISLLRDCIALLSPGGKIYLSINAKHNKTNAARLESELSSVYKNIKITDITKKATDEDFRNRRTPVSLLVETLY